MTVDANGNTVGYNDYYPFGMTMPSRSMASSADPRYQFTSKERDAAETGYDYFDARYYDSWSGRWMEVDPMAEKYLGWSPYNYGLNNPIVFIDLHGDSAWTINNSWTQDMIKGYEKYAAKRAKEYAENGTHRTCEDFALGVVIDYASSNGLPLEITNGKGTFSAASDDFTDVAGFTDKVLSTTGASDLQNPANTVGVDMNQVGAGDLLLTRSNDVTANHVQLVTSVSNNSMTIYQGNANLFNGIPGASRFLGASNPNSLFYAGVSVTRGAIYFNNGNSVYVNRSTGSIINNYMSTKNIETRRWNFGGW
jgi:RHS repeat-associated protein